MRLPPAPRKRGELSSGALLFSPAAAKELSNITMMTQLVLCAHVAGVPLHDALVPPQRLQEVAAPCGGLTPCGTAADVTLATIDGSPPSQHTMRTLRRVIIDSLTVLHKLPETFISFTMEPSIASSYDLDLWEDKQLQALASHLAPSVMRFGGIDQDRTTYDFGIRERGERCARLQPSDFYEERDCLIMEGEQLKGIVDFTKAVGWDLVFGLNLATARSDIDEWIPEELEDLIWQSDPHRANASYFGLQLGNEPDLKCKVPGVNLRFACGRHPDIDTVLEDQMVIAVTPQQLASDYKRFRERLLDLWTNRSREKRPKVVGNDVASILKSYTEADYAEKFLDALEEPLDAFSYHFYYSSFEKGMNWTDFSTAETLDMFWDAAVSAADMIKKHGRGAELWLGETGSDNHGGEKNATSSFVAGFLWLDKLGIAAVTGHSHVFRQTFARTSYAVVGMLLSAERSPKPPPPPLPPVDFQPPPLPPPFQPPPASPPSSPHPGAPPHGPAYDNIPNPDYWTSILWRHLVGNLVLQSTDAKTNDGRGQDVRVYAFCSAEHLGHVGGVTLVVVQTKDTEAELDPKMLSQTDGARGRANLYWLTSYPGQPLSRDIFLNGQVLRVVDEETMELPRLNQMGVSLTAEQPIVLPPKSYGFIVLPEAGAAACSQQ